MNTSRQSWILFIALCIIWGSSFILMKLGLFDAAGNVVLSAWQVAAIRIFTSGLVLLPFALKAWRQIPGALRWTVIGSGILGSFLPAFLFSIAETRIDSALAGALNATTPIFTMIIAWAFYKKHFPGHKVFGILIGLMGCLLLFFYKGISAASNTWYSLFVVIATICYGWNVNLVRQKLQGIDALSIASLAFAGLILPSLVILLVSGYFTLSLTEGPYIWATLASTTLGVVGTAFASVIFYKLVKNAGVIIASLVTYGIPFVALGWGIVYGEQVNFIQLLALAIILTGVYLANKNAGKKIPNEPR